MDKDKYADGNAPCSWFEMQQFIGDLITSGNPSGQAAKEHHDLLHVPWGLAGGEALGLKGAAQDKSDPDHGRLMLSGAPERRAEFRDRKEVENELNACTCTGCPFSTSPPSYETLKPRKSLSSQPRSDKISHPKDLSSNPTMSLNLCLPDDDPTEPSSTSSDLGPRPARSHKDTSGQCSSQASEQALESSSSRASAGSLPHFPMFPCLCHHSLQACAQILRQQEGAGSQAHAQHHFHHHHCAFSSCIPCPQLAHSHPHSAQLPAPFSCLACQHPFTCAQLCHKQHGQKHTQKQQEGGKTGIATPLLHPCMHCPASFPRPSQLLQHQRAEHSHKPAGFLCTECGRAFNSHSNLRIHLNVHTGARPYTCSDCGKSFSQSGALKIHMRIHTGERPYSCAFCGRGFPHLAGVRAHQRTHTGEKPYRCGLCGKSFTQSGALKIHTRMHTGERPFTCTVCGKGFANRSGIRFHYRAVHGLASEPVGSAGSGASYREPAGHAFPSTAAGRPRASHSASALLNSCNNPESDSRTSLLPRVPPDQGAAPGLALLARTSGKVQSERAHPGANKERLVYACEDCGQCFKDAPSRNRHQTLVHYSQEGKDAAATDAGPGKELQNDGADGHMN